MHCGVAYESVHSLARGHVMRVCEWTLYVVSSWHTEYMRHEVCNSLVYHIFEWKSKHIWELKGELLKIWFPCSKCFKERNCKISTQGFNVNGVSLNVSEWAVHLGHHVSTKDKECTVNAPKSSFGGTLNLFISDYGHIYSFLKNDFLGNITVVTMSHLCGQCRVSVACCFLSSETINIEFDMFKG